MTQITLDVRLSGGQNVAMSERPRKPVNVRRADVLEKIRGEVSQYQSPLVEAIHGLPGAVLRLPKLHLHLAAQFGFCDGVRRAIEIAHAACRMFAGKRVWLIGEIIHNPEVNARLDAMGLRHLPWDMSAAAYEALTPDDVVIIPAFGLPVAMWRMLQEKGVQLVDTTCGNVVMVWNRVRRYARLGITSIIHGKAQHEESLATASRSLGDDGKGHYLIIYSEEDARFVADFIRGRISAEAFLSRFSHCCSRGFEPGRDLCEIGMANQTTMLKDETARIQQMLREAVAERDGSEARFHAFDTICGATQDRQNALYALLEAPLDAMLIVGGYNSSNTTHLAQIASRRVPTFFVRDADCLIGGGLCRAWDAEAREERVVPLPEAVSHPETPCRIGLTAGASCPANVIEAVIRRLAEVCGCTEDLEAFCCSVSA